ncbi:hypothetical protein [Micromonospora sp. NBC_01796]|uniref:hypothetical protein n=1 Tax=Micromonospora sp. NBC_01796 TaxID=2975987 RepID=UPI002DDA1CD2|nr:hypothetical protein [Micromonospora sp. NBC_01796]WSA85188.1 hypothetical protein OIE47_33325 [Micromonospora sp. NBC_01796]
MADTPTTDGEAPTTALLERVLAEAAEVLIIESSPDELRRTDAARIVVSGSEIADLARLLAIVDGGTGDHCRCRGWPTILVSDPSGRELARWTLHHQTGLRGLGNCDAELRDGPGLTDWLADHGLRRSREVQQLLARRAADDEERRTAWVHAAPQPLAEAAEAVSLREAGAEERLADLAARVYPDAGERIRNLVAWAGFPPRRTSADGTNGTPWYELTPQRILLAEPTEAIFDGLTSATLNPNQLDGAAELFTSLEWTSPQRADIPEALRSLLVEHVAATGTDPMKFRMRHGYGAKPIT